MALRAKFKQRGIGYLQKFLCFRPYQEESIMASMLQRSSSEKLQKEYSCLIHAEDSDALMKLLTFEKVEEMVKKTAVKKAMVLGQNVTLADKVNNFTVDGDEGKFKVDPSVVSRLCADCVMPLTTEVEYLLHRLD